MFGSGDRDLANLPPKVASGAADILLDLGSGGLDDARRLLPGALDDPPLFFGRFSKRGVPNRLGFGVDGLQPRQMLGLQAPGLGPGGLGFLKCSFDRLAALLHLGQKRPIQKPPEDEEQEDEVDGLNDQRPVEVDEAAFRGKRRTREKRPEEEDRWQSP